MDIAIVIPAYEEAENIEILIFSILKILQNPKIIMHIKIYLIMKFSSIFLCLFLKLQ